MLTWLIKEKFLYHTCHQKRLSKAFRIKFFDSDMSNRYGSEIVAIAAYRVSFLSPVRQPECVKDGSP